VSFTNEQIQTVVTAIAAVRLDYCAWDVWEELQRIPGTPQDIVDAAEKTWEHLADRSDDAVSEVAKALQRSNGLGPLCDEEGSITDDAYDGLRDALIESMWEHSDRDGALKALGKIEEDDRLTVHAGGPPERPAS
jgi:hypothetical protein